jgi:hypothetical protein
MSENINTYPIISNFRDYKFYSEDSIIYLEMPNSTGLLRLLYDIDIHQYRIIELLPYKNLNEYFINKLKG